MGMQWNHIDGIDRARIDRAGDAFRLFAAPADGGGRATIAPPAHDVIGGIIAGKRGGTGAATGGTIARGTGADAPAPTTAPIAIRAEHLVKDYGKGDSTVHALRGVDLGFEKGRFTAIMGPSGSGKSTLMHMLAGLDTVTDGHVWLGDTDLTTLNDNQLTELRRHRIGFIFQSFNLLPMFTAEQNILMPFTLAGTKPDQAWFRQLVRTLGLAERLNHRPTEMSGGQQQRVAIARALVTKPEVVFADEPTGNLDSVSSAEVLSFLAKSVRELGQTVVMVTHDAAAASYADRAIVIADGRVVADEPHPTAARMNDVLMQVRQRIVGAAGIENR